MRAEVKLSLKPSQKNQARLCYCFDNIIKVIASKSSIPGCILRFFALYNLPYQASAKVMLFPFPVPLPMKEYFPSQLSHTKKGEPG